MMEEFKSKFGNKVTHMNGWDSPGIDTSIWYNIMCDCCDDSHDTAIEFEYDKECNMLFLNFYRKINYSKQFGFRCDDDTLVDLIKDRIKIIWNRFKDATKLLFTGYIEMHSEFILKDKQHIQDFIDALIEGRDYCLRTRDLPTEDKSTIDDEPGC